MNTAPKKMNDHDLKEKAKNLTDTLIIDIRSPSEYAREHIPGSLNIPAEQLSQTDTQGWQGKTLIFHCKSGMRTQHAQDIITALPGKEKYCLTGGIEQWKACGLTVKQDQKAPLELMRQVQIIAGFLILLGILLAYWLSPYFILLTAFVGLGFLVAGITGFCGMARLLMLLPYNRPQNRQ